MARVSNKKNEKLAGSPASKLAAIRKHRKNAMSAGNRTSTAPKNTGIDKKKAATLLISLKDSVFRVGNI